MMKGAATIACGALTSHLRTGRSVWEGYYRNAGVSFLSGANFHASLTHSDDRVTGNVRVGHLVDGVIFEDSKCSLDAGHVLGRSVYQEIDVFGGARTAVGNHGEAPDEDVAGPGFVQRAAESDEVLNLRLACVRAIVRVIHASASSKLLKR